jgi:hypothetical protein
MVQNVAAEGESAAEAAPFADDQPNTRIPSPCVGGGNDSTAWTGAGHNQGAKRLSRPSLTIV